MKTALMTYPEGNLFPKGTPKTRPEIYVMGDTVTLTVYRLIKKHG
jgi:hypothetical protein